MHNTKSARSTRGCKAPTYVAGTNGRKMPCGSTLRGPDGTGSIRLCAFCASSDAEWLHGISWDQPLAAPGLTSYRLRGPFGWIMIGAHDHEHAMREAARSTATPRRDALQIWDGSQYVDAAAYSAHP